MASAKDEVNQQEVAHEVASSDYDQAAGPDYEAGGDPDYDEYADPDSQEASQEWYARKQK